MTNPEEPLAFVCEGAQLAGILHRAGATADTGIVIVVGGPQYRVGSHRQFLLLARYLASHGTPVLRFDCRGMGDSEGELAGFEHIDADISSAIDAFRGALPDLKRIVLWGLCDAASALMFYGYRDARVKGMVLLNPWMRSEATQARTYLRHYYVSQLCSRDFWRRLAGGQIASKQAIGALISNVLKALSSKVRQTGVAEIDDRDTPFPQRMRLGLEQFKGQILIVLSGKDLTAAEFRDTISDSTDWRRLLARSMVTHRELPEANHTFSSEAWRDQIARMTLEWLRSW